MDRSKGLGVEGVTHSFHSHYVIANILLISGTYCAQDISVSSREKRQWEAKGGLTNIYRYVDMYVESEKIYALRYSSSERQC